MWEPDGWGSRARIGLLTPHNDIVPESEFRAMAPDGVSIHAARVPLGWRSGPEPPPIGLDAVRAFAESPHVDEAAELLSATPVSVIAYAFTSSSYLLGPDGDAALGERLEKRAHGIPIVIPCRSVVSAFCALEVRRFAFIHPPWFPAELDRLGADYFRSAGFEVVYAAAAVGLPTSQLSVQPRDVYEWVRTHVPETADAVFIGGGGLRAVGAIRALEEVLGRPVLTANQVCFWHALRLARLDVSEGMLAVAARITPEIEWRQGLAESLPFADHAFRRRGQPVRPDVLRRPPDCHPRNGAGAAPRWAPGGGRMGRP